MTRRFLPLLLTVLGLLFSPAYAQSPEARVVRGHLAVSDDGATVATSTGTGTLLLWDATTWTLTRQYTADGSQVFGFDFSADGHTGFFASVGGDVIAVDLVTGDRLDSVRAHPDFVSDLELSPDGTLLAANDLNGHTTLIDTDTRSIVRRTSQDGSFQSGRLLFAVAFRPGTHEVITGGIRMPIVVWDASTGDRKRTIATLPHSR